MVQEYQDQTIIKNLSDINERKARSQAGFFYNCVPGHEYFKSTGFLHHQPDIFNNAGLQFHARNKQAELQQSNDYGVLDPFPGRGFGGYTGIPLIRI